VHRDVIKGMYGLYEVACCWSSICCCCWSSVDWPNICCCVTLPRKLGTCKGA
jgi:hypothetical protein